MQQLPGQMSIFDLDMPCGKMFPEHSAATKEKILESSSKNSAKSQTKQPMFLNLKRGNGTLVGASWEMGIPSHGECLMRDFGESPREEEESGLSQILEANVPLKYYLSAKACEGVLRRAKKRGKELPKILETALKQQIERWEKYGTPLPYVQATAAVICFDGENVTSPINKSNPKIGDPCHTLGTGAGRTYCVECYDARGNGDGKISPTITGDHNSRITDYTTLVCEQKVYAIDSLSSNSMKSKNPKSGFHEEKFFKCLDTSNGDSTKNQGGNVVVERYAANSSGGDIASTIDAHYYLGCGARGGKEREFLAISIDRAAFNQGENAKYDIGIDKTGIAQTVVAKGPGAVCYEESKFYVVRRLTPLECCRLQGMPDFWCQDIPHSDAQEYKMWGNGMALPNALYIMEGF